MADFASKRTMLVRRLGQRGDGEWVFRREPWDLVNIPSLGECWEPVDWTGNLTVYATDKEYTGIQIIDHSLSATKGFQVGGDMDIPRS